jgi:hypothetical protein
MNREIADRINKSVEDIIAIANDITFVLNNNEDENSGKFKRALAVAITEIDLEILEPIYKQFPDLRPPNMMEIKPV